MLKIEYASFAEDEFHSAEWQANTMAASLLMPRFLVENAMNRFADSKPRGW